MPSIQLPLPFPPEIEWRIIPGFNDQYEAGSNGQIRRRSAVNRYPAGMILKPSVVKGGYLRVGLIINKGQPNKEFLVHRLIMLAFRGECPPKYEVNHINFKRDDNRVENLEYCTKGQNIKHSYDHDRRSAAGMKHPRAKLTDNDVRAIRQARADGIHGKVLAKQYDVTTSMIYFIANRRAWTHVE